MAGFVLTEIFPGSSRVARVSDLRASAVQKCAAFPRRARIQGSWTFESLNSRLESNKEKDDEDQPARQVKRKRFKRSQARDNRLRALRSSERERCPDILFARAIIQLFAAVRLLVWLTLEPLAGDIGATIGTTPDWRRV